MGRVFGAIGKVRKQVTYAISPYEIKIFHKYVQTGFPNIVRRFGESWWKVLWATPILYYTWSTSEYRLMRGERKNPADFVNDE